MLLISARKDFWNDNKLAKKDKARHVDLVGSKPSVKVPKPIKYLKGKRILMLIHGYNNEPEDVHNAYAMIEANIETHAASAYDEVIGYIWPGGDGPFDYAPAKKRANALARRVGIWLEKMKEADVTVDVMVHSMGARVIFKALKTTSATYARHIFTMAAAVDNESIEKDEEFFPSTNRCESVFVFHSRHDGVLRGPYFIAEFDRALGLHGPENPADIIAHSSPANPATPSVYVVNCKNKVKKHGAYKRTVDIYTFVSKAAAGTAINQFETL